MVTATINKEQVKVAVCWGETDTATFQRIKGVEDTKNILQVFSAAVNKKFTEVAKAKDEGLEMAMYQLVNYVFNEDEYFRRLEMPSSLKIGNRVILIPKKLERMTMEQNMIVRQAIQKHKFKEQLISIACAVYLQPQIDGTDFNADRVPEIEKEIAALPIQDTFQIGFFLLERLKNFGHVGFLSLLLKKLKLIKLKRNFKSWHKLKNLTPSQTWR